MFNRIDFLNNLDKMDAAVCDVKEIFGAHKPYTKVRKLSGDEWVMNKHFTDQMLVAFNTDCLSNMSTEEADFLKHFIDWQNFLLADPQNPIEPNSPEDTFVTSEREQLTALNNWLVDELAETPHPTICGE